MEGEPIYVRTYVRSHAISLCYGVTEIVLTRGAPINNDLRPFQIVVPQLASSPSMPFADVQRTYVRTYVRRLRRSSSDAIFFDVRAPPVPRTPLFRAIAPQRARMQANAPFCNACIWDQSRLSNTYVHTFTHSPVFTARISSTGFKCARTPFVQLPRIRAEYARTPFVQLHQIRTTTPNCTLPHSCRF